jgi:DNA-binding transcriptional LysR family regulator
MNDLIDPLLTDLALLVRVADAGGFTAAAQLTKIPQATVSRRIAALELKLDARLLDRTTRTVALKEPGRRVYEHAKRMLEQGEAASAALRAMQAAPTGSLRVTCTVMLGQAFVKDIVTEYMETYPEVSVKLELTGRRVDIIEEGFDVAIRIGKIPDSGLAITSLGQARSGLFASPAYLETAETITRPLDLAKHPFLSNGVSLENRALTFDRDGVVEKVEVTPRMACNDAQPILAATLKGLGVGRVPTFVAARDVEAGTLVRVLDGWSLPPTTLSGLTPSYRGTLPAVSQFLALAKERLKTVT